MKVVRARIRYNYSCEFVCVRMHGPKLDERERVRANQFFFHQINGTKLLLIEMAKKRHLCSSEK